LIVVDASLFVGCLLNEPSAQADGAFWDRLSAETLFVPAHWSNEIANALRKAVRTKRLAVNEVIPIAQRIGVFDIEFAVPTPIGAIGALASEALRHGLSVYDMIYVQLAWDHRLALATIDRSMRVAAAAIGVPVLPA
jgi:predicted nucleic acid-binding protein